MDGRRAGQAVISLAVIGIGFAMTANGQDFTPVSTTDSTPTASSQLTPPLSNVSPADYKPEFPDEPELGPVLARLGCGLLFVIVACGGTIWFGRRWVKKHGLPGIRDGEVLRIVESTRLGGHCTVHLLDIGGQRVLAGTDRTGLHSIVPLPEPFSNVLDEQAPEYTAEPARNGRLNTQTAEPQVDSAAAETPTRPVSGPRIVRSRRAVAAPEPTAAAG